MVKKHDFIQINYTGKIKETGQVFDTTNDAIAKESNIHNPKMKYEPTIICVGERQIIKGLDEQIIGKEVGKTYTFEVESKDAFGKKDAKLIKLIPTNIFKKQKINPFVGLEVNIDGQYGVVRSINGGRTLIDFNHPLAGKDIEYEVEIIKKIDDAKEKIDSLITLTLNIEKPKTKVENDELVVEEKIPIEIQPLITKKIQEMIPSIGKVSYK
jgi:peptidylprolyl isomerase/FKBP-type peptidyl-prolyl cis-trans isomerase SlyD